MADIYDRAKLLAARQLAPRSAGGKGLQMTITRSIEGAYDPATGTQALTSTAYEGSAFRDTYAAKDIDGTNVLATDVKFLVSPQQQNGADMPSPEVGDRLLFDGQEYGVVSVRPYNYAGLAVAFEVQARLS